MTTPTPIPDFTHLNPRLWYSAALALDGDRVWLALDGSAPAGALAWPMPLDAVAPALRALDRRVPLASVRILADHPYAQAGLAKTPGAFPNGVATALAGILRTCQYAPPLPVQGDPAKAAALHASEAALAPAHAYFSNTGPLPAPESAPSVPVAVGAARVGTVFALVSIERQGQVIRTVSTTQAGVFANLLEYVLEHTHGALSLSPALGNVVANGMIAHAGLGVSFRQPEHVEGRSAGELAAELALGVLSDVNGDCAAVPAPLPQEL